MGANINVTLPEKVATYLKRKAQKEYLTVSSVARQYLARSVTEEMIIDYYHKGYSIHKISEMTDTPISRVLEVLSKLGEDLEDLEAELRELEEA